MLYTGLDLHKSFSYITTMNDNGEIVGQKKLPSNGEVLRKAMPYYLAIVFLSSLEAWLILRLLRDFRN